MCICKRTAQKCLTDLKMTKINVWEKMEHRIAATKIAGEQRAVWKYRLRVTQARQRHQNPEHRLFAEEDLHQK